MTTTDDIQNRADEDDVIEALPDFSQIETIQPEEDDETFDDWDMGYSRFSRYYNSATRRLASDITSRYGDMEIADDEDVIELVCYLIADLDIRRDNGWSNSSESTGGGVSFSRSRWNGDIVTEPRRKYEELLDRLSLEAGYGLMGLGSAAAEAVVTHCSEADLENVLKDSLEKSGYDPVSFIDEA